MNKIFGYDWEDIQRAQQKQGSLHKLVVPNSDPNADIIKYAESDAALLAQHGEQGLHDKKLFGVLDRLQRAGIINKQ